MISINEPIPRIKKKPKPSSGGSSNPDVKMVTAGFKVTIDTNPYPIPYSSSLPSVASQQMVTVGFGDISYKKLATAAGFTPETVVGVDSQGYGLWLPSHFGVLNASRGDWPNASGGKSFEVVDVTLGLKTISGSHGILVEDDYKISILATVFNRYSSSATPTWTNINMTNFILSLWRSDGQGLKTSGMIANLSNLRV